MANARKKKKWVVQYDAADQAAEEAVARIAQQIGLSPLTARLLYLRGYRSVEDVERFLRMEETALHDPFLLTDMQKAVERVEQALERGERIAIYGDYDVDGVTSVSLLYLYLQQRGADVGYYIPSRSLEGYGMSVAAVDRLREKGVKLIITVDTGITAYTETAYAKTLGIDVVVTDHHECRAELPEACAVVNPHRSGDVYPFRELAGVGVVFKLVTALEMKLCERRGEPVVDGVRRVCRSYADLAALGTVADVMPVRDENRLIISMGIRRMETDCRLGIRELMNAAMTPASKEKGKAQRKITSTYIGFVLAPRMNAAGRVSNASIAVELLLADDKSQAEKLAQELCELNTQRQVEENRITEEAYRKIEEIPQADRARVLVLDDDFWHQGIIGIVSSRITERYGLPSILISYDGSIGVSPSETDIGKGSGRSIQGLNLVEALADSESLLVRYGGHEMAAGLSIRRRDVEAFRKRINEYAMERLGEEALFGSLDADCETQISELSIAVAEELNRLEPFGVSNPVPCFVLRDAKVSRIAAMGGGKHVRFQVEKDGHTASAVWFGTGISELPFEATDPVDLLFQLNVNEYLGRSSLQLVIQDASVSCRYEQELDAQRARYEAIRLGAEYTAKERILPDREDCAVVYTFLKREARAGRTAFSMRYLMGAIPSSDGLGFNYIKLKFIIRILQELQICDVTEPVPDHLMFDMLSTNKTNLEKSSILHRLRGQLRREDRL